MANTALEKNLVINLSDVDVPLYSIAILVYGPEWIPRPTFQDTQFKVDGYNAANKQCWKALYKDSERTNDVPMSLLKKPITSMCTNVEDPAIRSVRESIVSFVDNFKPKKQQSNMNRHEREGYNWLRNAVKDGIIAVTTAD